MNDYEQVEDEYGFTYMKKKQKFIKEQQQQQRVKEVEAESSSFDVLSTPVPKSGTLTLSGKPTKSTGSTINISGISKNLRTNDAF